MARQVITSVLFTSHITGKSESLPADNVPDAVTVTLKGQLAGKAFTKSANLDITAEEFDALTAFLTNPDETPLLEALGAKPVTSSANGSKSVNPLNSEMREWLTAHGHQVGAKGRISEDLQEVFYKNNPDKKPAA